MPDQSFVGTLDGQSNSLTLWQFLGMEGPSGQWSQYSSSHQQTQEHRTSGLFLGCLVFDSLFWRIANWVQRWKLLRRSSQISKGMKPCVCIHFLSQWDICNINSIGHWNSQGPIAKRANPPWNYHNWTQSSENTTCWGRKGSPFPSAFCPMSFLCLPLFAK